MTDKELKKLSRLELLEILLEETKENESLKKELGTAHKVAHNNAVLLNLIDRLNKTLSQADEITARLNETSESFVTAEHRLQECPAEAQEGTEHRKAQNRINEADKNIIMADLKLFWRIMNHYLKNEEALDLLPSDIRDDIRTRIRGILDAKKQKADD